MARCIERGLASGQRMAVDASLIEADANKQNSTPKEEWDASTINPADAGRAVREYLDTLDDTAFGAASDVQPKFTPHSSSPPPSKISANQPRSFLRRSKCAKPDKKGACAEFRTDISARANVSFFTKSAGRGRSLRVRVTRTAISKTTFKSLL